MLRTMAIQTGARATDHAPSREHDPAVAALIDRGGHAIRDTEPLSAAIERLLGRGTWGVPVIGADDTYRGCCTFRSVASLCLLINGETAALMPSLGFLRDDFDRIRERLGSSLTMPVGQAIDPFVPTINVSATLPEIFFHFYRGQPLLPVIEEETRRLVGVITCQRALLAAALDRPAPASR
jgi:hypothetical protein